MAKRVSYSVILMILKLLQVLHKLLKANVTKCFSMYVALCRQLGILCAVKKKKDRLKCFAELHETAE